MNDFFLKENSDFIPFSVQHLLVVVFLFLFGYILIKWAKKQSEKIQILTGNILTITISLFVIIGFVLRLYSNNFNIQEHLPLHLCSFLALIIPIVSIKRNYVHYEIVFFLILAGTLQSLITPSSYSFLNFEFFRYWFVHAGLVIFMMYATFIYNMQPTLKSVLKSFIGMQVYMVLMFILNYFLGSNYFYTNRKPDSASMLDLFGEWPYYVFVVELIVIPFFLLIYLPFYLTRKRV
ncbi:YwaF family protein [Polaribacter gochangensis]|uniref:YwaF family protein n=1 Tax=Polaribacter gochangensis TaxID=3252903 RepID=UPI003904D46E